MASGNGVVPVPLCVGSTLRVEFGVILEDSSLSDVALVVSILLGLGRSAHLVVLGGGHAGGDVGLASVDLADLEALAATLAVVVDLLVGSEEVKVENPGGNAGTLLGSTIALREGVGEFDLGGRKSGGSLLGGSGLNGLGLLAEGCEGGSLLGGGGLNGLGLLAEGGEGGSLLGGSGRDRGSLLGEGIEGGGLLSGGDRGRGSLLAEGAEGVDRGNSDGSDESGGKLHVEGYNQKMRR